MTGRPYRDRREAGRYLATKVAGYTGRPDVLVLALPRGGVPVAYEVARALDVPLDVFLVRKLGVPGHEELAMGAIASGGLSCSITRWCEPGDRPESHRRGDRRLSGPSSSAATGNIEETARRPTCAARR